MFAAVLRHRSAPTAIDADQMLTTIRQWHPGDAAGRFEDPAFCAAQTLMRITPESVREPVPVVEASTGRVMVSWLRLDNRSDLAATLGWDPARGDATSDAELALAAYDRWGTACAAHLEGDFALAIWDPALRSVYAARDATGIRPLYYCATPRLFACATSAPPLKLLGADGVDLSVRPEWIARSLHRVAMDWVETPFAGLSRVPPGHWVLAGDAGVRVERYHEFVDDAPWETTRADHWLEDYRARLHEAVRARIRTTDPIGVESSGGLDSSSVLALIATLAPETRATMHAFGFVLEPLEPEYILETSRVLGVRHNHVLIRVGSTTEEVARARRRGWDTVGYPVEHANSTGHIAFYDLARQFGVRTLHSGHGGDEVVTNPAVLALHERAARRDYRGLVRDVGGRPLRRARTVAGVVRDRRGSPLTALTGRLGASPVRAALLEELGVSERVRVASTWDATHETVNSFVLGNRIAPFVSVRTAECSLVAASYGVEYHWPLLDRRLMQQWLSTPAAWKYAAGTDRYLHRRAVDGVVPAKVAWKPSKNMSGGPSEAPRAAEPGPEWAGLHPDVADLLDRERWESAARLHDVFLRRPLVRAQEISDWLADATWVAPGALS